MKKAKNVILLAFCGLAVLFLYHHANKMPDTGSMQVKKSNGDESSQEESVSLELPKTYKKDIPGSCLSFDAEVVVPQEFDATNYYEGTAVQSFDRKKIRNVLFGENAKVQQNIDSITNDWGEKETEEIDEDTKGNFCLIDDKSYMYYIKSPEMDYVDNCVRVDSIESENNLKDLDEQNTLDFMTRDEAEKEVEGLLEDMGFSVQGNTYRVFGLDVDTLKEQEMVKDMYGNEIEEEKNPQWSKEQEGYYFFGQQTFQGLPVYEYSAVPGNGYYENVDACPLQVFYSSQGMMKCKIENYYHMDVGEEKMIFAPFEKIVEAVEEKYSDIDANQLIVRKMKLMAVSQRQKDGSCRMLPVWICYLESIMDNGESETLYVMMPINAITGEEAVEMEGIS